MPKEDPKDRLWLSIEKKRLSKQRWAATRIRRGLRESIRDTIYSLRQFGIAGVGDIELSQEPIEDAYKDIYEKVGVEFAQASFRAFKSRKDESAVNDYWVQYMREFAVTESGERIKEVTKTTLSRIRRVIEQGVTEGAGIDVIAREMERSTAVSRARATTIARTEIISASNRGSLLGMESTGVQMRKEWVSTRDARTRDDHVAVDGQLVEQNEGFNVGGEELKYPGDPMGSAGNVINCRCAVAGVPYE